MVMLEEIVMNNVRQVDNIWGWRRQIFDQLGGPDLVRSSFDRLVLLKQARDIMRKITILKESPLIPDDERSRIDQFIASTALLDSRQGEWFADSVAVLRTLEATIGEGDISGVYGLDLQAFRGSSPNLADVSYGEHEREKERKMVILRPV